MLDETTLLLACKWEGIACWSTAILSRCHIDSESQTWYNKTLNLQPMSGNCRELSREEPMIDDNSTLNGSVPDKAPVVLLLIDVINDLEFDGGEALLPFGLAAAQRIAALKREARAAGIPAIYVNDNFGRWQSDFNNLIEHCLEDGVRGEAVVRLLVPEPHDYFILKPKHSAFFQTALDTLLIHLNARTLILTGFAADFCVLFTANDAYMRGYSVFVPGDCVAAESMEYTNQTLALIERVLKADIRDSGQLDLSELLANARKMR